MKKEFALLLIFSLAGIHNLPAQGKKYAAGDSVFVWASSLNIRESAASDGKIIGKVAYGSYIWVVEDTAKKMAYRYKALEKADGPHSEKSKPFYLNGYWVKVRHKGVVGYVFDGYLSNVKTKSLGEDKFGLLESWATQDLKLTAHKIVEKETENAWTEYAGKPDLVRVRIGHDSKTSFREVKFKNLSFEEACMLGVRLFDGKYMMKFGADEAVFKSKDDNGDCDIWISKKEDWIVITLTCSC